MLLRVSGIGGRGVRPGSALINPGAQQTDLLGRERVAFLGHAGQVLFQPGDGVNQQAFGALAGHKQRTGLASLERGDPLIEA